MNFNKPLNIVKNEETCLFLQMRSFIFQLDLIDSIKFVKVNHELHISLETEHTLRNIFTV